MSNTKIALKTFPDLVDQHKDLPVDYFEVAIRPTIFGKETSLDTQLEAYATIADKVIGIHGAIYREGVNLLDPNAKEMNQKAFHYVNEASRYFTNSNYNLFHPGNIIPNSNCSFNTLFNFLKTNHLENLVIEFEPFFAYDQRFVFPIHAIKDWEIFKNTIQKPIVLDTAHCFITAQALGYKFYHYFETLVKKLNPNIIHLSSTDMSDGGINDKHLPFEKGCIDFKKLAPLLYNKTLVIEVNNVSENDIYYIKSIMQKVTASS